MEESECLHERHTQDGDQLHRTEILYDRADNEQKTLSEHMWNTYEATLATAEEFRLPLRRKIARYFQTTVHKKSLRHLLYVGGIVDFTRNRLPPEKSAATLHPPLRR